jgi:ABC-type polar amino acid transport system ATPase subunit
MDDGKIVEENAAADFFKNPQQERTKKFIDKFMQQSMYYI